MSRSTNRFPTTLCLTSAIAGSIFAGLVRGDEKPKAPRLEFRILANEVDEPKALEAAKKVFVLAKKDEKLKKELERLAKEGKPPMPVALATDKAPGYTWVEIGPSMLKSLYLDESKVTDDDFNGNWKAAKAARATAEALTLKDRDSCLLFSRTCLDTTLSEKERGRKKFDYFLLTRDPQKGKSLTGKHLIDAKIGKDEHSTHGCVEIEFGKEGGDLMFELTNANRPDQDGDPVIFKRCLAIIVAGKVFAAPGLVDPIKSKAVISGRFSREEIESLVKGLRTDIAGTKK